MYAPWFTVRTIIAILYFVIPQPQHNYLAHRQAYVSAEVLTASDLQQSQASDSSDILYTEDFSRQDKRSFEDESKDAIKKLLNLKQRPSDAITTANTKFYVPRAMFEMYIKTRDNVRDFIPNDKDFFGKLNIDELDEVHEDFWTKMYEENGSFNIQVDMRRPTRDPDELRKSRLKEEGTHIAHITMIGEPKIISPNIEPLLPPHANNIQSQRKFLSVHLRFNLSQEIYSGPTAVADLRYAELYLSRDKIDECSFRQCESKPMPFFQRDEAKVTSGNQTIVKQNAAATDGTNKIHIMPATQRLYILLVTGFDEYNEPKAQVINSRKISTSSTTPIIIDVSKAVASWIQDPSSNHGIIVRVTNEDELFERQIKQIRKNKRETKASLTPNASDSDDVDDASMLIPEIQYLDHVRLKRSFGDTSDNDDTWLKKQPSLLIYSKPEEPERHVKRHVSGHEDETDEMQADDPEVVTRNYQQASFSLSSTQSKHHTSRDTNTHTDKPTVTTLETVTKRDHIPTASSGGGGTTRQRGRASANGRASSQGSNQRVRGKGKPSVRQSDKCSKKALEINFDDVGWSNWIIAPRTYFANYCSGECTWPLSDAQNSTNHAIIQAIYHSVGRVVPKSCCAPVKLASIYILYQLDGVVQLKLYEDMIIEACGCL